MADRLKAGIASHDELRARAVAIAKGERRRRPNEPKIWFTSRESLARVALGTERGAAAGWVIPVYGRPWTHRHEEGSQHV